MMKSPFLDEELLSAEARLDFHPSLERLAKESPLLEASLEFVEEEVLGKDDRTLVADTLKVPNRWICAIDILIDNPDWPKSGPQLISKSRATGVLVGPRYVLTAAHVRGKQTIEVDGKEQEVDVKGFLVSPARNGNNSKNPFGAVKSKAIRVSPPYRVLRKKTIQSKTVEVPITQIDDYALIILEKDLDTSTHSRMSGVLGYWGHDQSQAVVQRMEPSAIEGKKVVVLGYPGDRCGKDAITGSRSRKLDRMEYCRRTRIDEWASTQWKDLGTLQVEENSTNVFHTADTYDGQSGAPICLSVDGKLVLIGIHTNSSDAHKNKGVRVTRKTLRELCAWMNDDAGYEIGTIKTRYPHRSAAGEAD